MIEEIQEVQDAAKEVQAAAQEVISPRVASHFAIWQAAEQWADKLEDSLKIEFAQFVEQYKRLF